MKQSPKQQNGRITNGRQRASIVVAAGTCFEINFIIIGTRRGKRGVRAEGRKEGGGRHGITSKKQKKRKEDDRNRKERNAVLATETFNTIHTTLHMT